jgi:riboflavin-specific deaminase-like protein
MVMSADGKAVAGQTESALSSSTDKLVLQALRAHADAILNGAGTARSTGLNPSIADARLRSYRTDRLGLPSPPLQAVITGSGDLDAHSRFLQQNAFKVAVFVAASAGAAQLAALRSTGQDVYVFETGVNGLLEIMRVLRERHGVQRLLLEGGPTLNGELFHAALIDEMFTTVGPHVEGGRDVITTVAGEVFPSGSMPRLELVSAYPSPATSEVYLHWRVDRSNSN